MTKWIVIVLTAIFTGLKLASVISWSWWLVFLPAIILVGIWLLFFIVAFMIAVIQSGDY